MVYNSAVRLLDRAAELFGDSPAVEDGKLALTYSQYRAQARSIGTALIKAGCSGKPVMVLLPKNVQALLCFMGCMYAACPYAPTNAATPPERLKKIIDSLRPAAVITDESLAGALEGCSVKVLTVSRLLETQADDALIEPVLSRVVDSDPIYIMYTSGSTGMPKGVAIPHRGIVDYANWVVDTFGFDRTTVMANQAPFYFDNSTFDIYGSLLSGARLILIPEVLINFPGSLPEFLAEHRVTSIFWVPTVLINIANSGVLDKIKPETLKTVAFCGEVMPTKQFNIWRGALPQCTYANLYGPTEITDVCCYYIVDRQFEDSQPLPIGRPCKNMRAFVLDEQGRQVLPGREGELCISGTGLALGYWNDPEKTAAAFTELPGPFGERVYHTGDLAVLGEDGLIYFRGRMDNQIKLKGNRIELGEIEAAAMCIPGVENAAAIFLQERELLALFVESGETWRLRQFNQLLKQYIPQYMLPRRLEVMSRLPHTANDKIDRVGLREYLARQVKES